MKNFYFINFKCFSVKEYLHLVRSNKKLLYLKKCDHISSLKKEYYVVKASVQMLIGSTYKMTEMIA